MGKLLDLMVQHVIIENGQAPSTMGQFCGHRGVPGAEPFGVPPGISLLHITHRGVEEGCNIALTLLALQAAQGAPRFLHGLDECQTRHVPRCGNRLCIPEEAL